MGILLPLSSFPFSYYFPKFLISSVPDFLSSYSYCGFFFDFICSI
jgi:hypothetical protein